MTKTLALTTPWHLLTETGTLQSFSTSVGSDGSQVITFASGTDYPCSVQPASSSDSLRYMRETGIQTFDVYIQPGVSVLRGYRLTVGGVQYRIVGPASDLCSKEVIQVFSAEAET